MTIVRTSHPTTWLFLMQVLILSNCNWVSPHDFMAISKCYQLEELRMDGCPQLGECVAYTSLAARFGFHSLKVSCILMFFLLVDI
jgi:hypothetical protein